MGSKHQSFQEKLKGLAEKAMESSEKENFFNDLVGEERQQVELKIKEKDNALFAKKEGSLFNNAYTYIFNLVTRKVTHKKGLSLILLDDSISQSDAEEKRFQRKFQSKTIKEQRNLIAFETYSLVNNFKLSNGFYYFSQRAIRPDLNDDDNVWLAHQYSRPASFLGEKMSSYITTVILVKKYEGEPYKSYVGTTLAKNGKSAIIEEFHKVKFEIAAAMEDQPHYQEVLKHFLMGLTTDDIVDKIAADLQKTEGLETTSRMILKKIPNYRKLKFEDLVEVIKKDALFNNVRKRLPQKIKVNFQESDKLVYNQESALYYFKEVCGLPNRRPETDH